MGMYIQRIEFTQGLPSFYAISQQFKRQTGLDLCLFPTIHLPSAPLPTSQQLTAALVRDAAAVAALDADYAAAQAPLVAAHQYEEAAATRDRFKATKDQFTYINGFTLAVRLDCDHLIPIEIAEHYLEIECGRDSYTVTSLIKCLLELGGQLPGADTQRMQTLHKEWRRLKWWQEYRWYNRPHR